MPITDIPNEKELYMKCDEGITLEYWVDSIIIGMEQVTIVAIVAWIMLVIWT
jgi:hypothetical protein